jgi:hypothetical protein
MANGTLLVQALRLSNHLVERAIAERRHDLPSSATKK